MLNEVMYTIIIDNLDKDKLVSDAQDLYSKMVDRGISPTVVTYSTLICVLCLVGQLKEATNLLNEMMLKNH